MIQVIPIGDEVINDRGAPSSYSSIPCNQLIEIRAFEKSFQLFTGSLASSLKIYIYIAYYYDIRNTQFINIQYFIFKDRYEIVNITLWGSVHAANEGWPRCFQV